MRFRVGVIGASGFIGVPYRREMRDVPEQYDIVAVCARRRELLEAAGREDGAALVTTDWREVVAHPDVDVVVVLVPDVMHYEIALECAAQGKHIVCEKPVAMNAREAHEIWTAYRDRGLGHFVPFWTRGVPVFQRARQLLAEGLIGEVRGVVYRWHNARLPSMPYTWRDDAEQSAAGSVADGGSHAYDALRWLTGLEARRVFAQAGVLTPPKPDLGEPNLEEALAWSESHDATAGESRRAGTAFDYGNLTFELDNGGVGVLMVSHAPYLRSALAPDVELHGSEASISIGRFTGDLHIARKPGESELLEALPAPDAPNNFRDMVHPGLLATMAGEPTEMPELHAGWRVQLFTDAAVASAERGAWVETAEFDAPDEA